MCKEIFQSNANTDGEQLIGTVTSAEECIELVQANCEWANIANVHENVLKNESADCWCQNGDDLTPDDTSGYVNCWFGETNSTAPPDGTELCADGFQNNANTENEELVGYVTSPLECIQLVQDQCEWANIANIHESMLADESAECWCQRGDDKTPDNTSEYYNCWFGPSEFTTTDGGMGYIVI